MVGAVYGGGGGRESNDREPQTFGKFDLGHRERGDTRGFLVRLVFGGGKNIWALLFHEALKLNE